MKVGIYDRSWGELICGAHMYVGKIAETLSSRGHDVSIVAHGGPISQTTLAEAFSLDLSKIDLRVVEPDKPARQGLGGLVDSLLGKSSYAQDLSKPYDLFLYSSSAEIPPVSHAARSVLLVHFPCISYDNYYAHSSEGWRRRPALLRFLLGSYHAWKWRRVFSSFDLVIANSDFTKQWIKRRWGVDSTVAYPPARVAQPIDVPKQPRIIAIGRFMADKKQDVLIDGFRRMCDQGLQGWQLELIGGSPRQGESDPYLKSLREKARGYPIEILTNLPSQDLNQRLSEASIFWHAKGYGEDAETNPQEFEHFGITTIEAMAARCVPLVFRGGGQIEIIREGIDGLFWETPVDLAEITLTLIRDDQRLEQLARSATERSAHFGDQAFDRRLIEILTPLFSGGRSSSTI